MYVCGVCGGALSKGSVGANWLHRTSPNCNRNPVPMLRAILEERLRQGDDVMAHMQKQKRDRPSK
jgi:hypothetical protein